MTNFIVLTLVNPPPPPRPPCSPPLPPKKEIPKVRNEQENRSVRHGNPRAQKMI